MVSAGRGILIAIGALLAIGAAAAPNAPYFNPDLPADQRIANLLSLMTLDEKIDALSTNSGVPRLGVPNFGSSEGIHGLQQRGNEERHRTAIPTTQFPQPPGMGESWNPDLVRQAGGVEGYEARYITQTPSYDRPILMLWGPQADLARDPRWGRSEEVYGEDPFFNGVMATAFARGLQGADPKYWQAAPLLKHFLANSNENDRTRTSSNFDERLFWEYYSVPFRMAFEDADASGVMASYNAWNGTPMTVHPVLRDVVIGKWGVDVVSSDGGAIKTLVKDHKSSANQKDAAVAALKAGINQYLDVYKDELRAALVDGSITEADLDEALERKFRTTIKLGLLDPPERVAYTRIHGGAPPWDGARHRGVSRQLALESIVLLKNSAGALPLNKARLKSVAVIGPLADSVHWDWYGGQPPYAVTPLQGIREAVGPGVRVNYAPDDSAGAAVAAARASDVAIVVVGNDPTCGPNMAHDWTDNGTKPCADAGDGREGRDRQTLTLAQEDLVRNVMAANPRTIMVLVSSFPYTINWSQEHVPAILHMAHSSQDEGWALAQVLFGAYNPGGHLVVTWPASIAQLPAMMDYDIRHGRTYMYAKGKPLYPFGYGLSYTRFRYANLRTDKPAVARNGRTIVSVDVTNVGDRSGDAVPQLYVRHRGSKVERPALKLEGFSRVTVAPGETKTVRIPLKAAQLAYWNGAQKAFVVEPEPVELMIGASSADIELRSTLQIR
ncbi:glycoside hydrolase family 3 C-terminal domain-containing protein [Sphingomonas crusticola]|uniref:glycoside hydrolase family 3 C-terminal domain-containing protein n=1 Tax=Sphingomonas crusticola TaxID=1697973 RepID=UPI000E274690|nr:glycoside hydrolase family 3 C-terminal domain-containing protein [Sphingomonas crusticola]